MFKTHMLNTVQLKPLVPLENGSYHSHNVFGELETTLQTFAYESTVIKSILLGERIEVLAEALHKRYPTAMIGVEPGHNSGQPLYSLRFPTLYDTGLVLTGGEEKVSGEVKVYLGSFLQWDGQNIIRWDTKTKKTHAIIVDFNSNMYAFEHWFEAIVFLDQKYVSSKPRNAQKRVLKPKK